MLNNPVTAREGMYEEMPTFDGGNFIFPWGRMNEQTGFAVEVFRGGAWALSLRPGDGNARLHRGDSLLKINLKQPILTWKGTFTTRNPQSGLNPYTHTYEANVQVAIYNSVQFAISCMQNADPLEQVRRSIAHELEAQVARDYYEDLTDERFRRIIVDGCRTIETLYGMRVFDRGVIRVIPAPDPRWKAEWDLLEQQRLDAIKQEEARRQLLLNSQTAAQADAQAGFIKGVGEEFTKGARQQIAGAIQEGVPLQDIARSLNLGGIIPELGSAGSQGQLGSGSDQGERRQLPQPEILDSDDSK